MWTAIPAALFWICMGLVVYVYLGYPAVIWVLSRIRPFRHTVDPSFTPMASVVLCAYNEEAVIGEKIRNLLDQDYPADRLEVLIASDASTDRTNEIVAAVEDARIRFFPQEERRGKSALLNLLIAEARGEVLILTDANSMFPPAVIRNLARHFSDPEVGLVTGEMRWIEEERETAVGKGSRAYWGYESAVKAAESRLGSVFVSVGSCFAVRRGLLGEMYPDVANDFQMPMEAGAAGRKLLYEPEAFSREYNTASGRQEYGRTVRIVTRGMTGTKRMWTRIRGLRRFQLVSRKVLRWLVPVYLLVALACAGALAPGSAFWGWLFALGVAFLAVAGIGWLWNRVAPGRVPRVLSIPYYFCLVNLAALHALARFLGGRGFSTWSPASDSRRTS